MKEAQGGWALVVVPLAWAAGVALQLQQAVLWGRSVYVTLAGLGLAVLIGGRWAGRRCSLCARWQLGVLGLAVLALALGSTGWRASVRLAEVLAPELEGVELLLVGRVAEMPQVDATGLRFVFEVERAAQGGQSVSVPSRVWLSWGRGWREDALLGPAAVALSGGERWQLPVRLRQPHGLLNPHGFDAELWLFEQGVRAVGSVREGTQGLARRLGPARPWVPTEALAAWRQGWRDQVLLAVSEPRVAGVLAALAVGDQSAIDGAGWSLFQRTGVAHLMSISGLHITLFAWLAERLVGWAWRGSRAAMLGWPAPTAARWGGWLLATLYAALAGWGVPAQRTVAMLGGSVLLRGLGWRWPPLLVCLWAGAAVSVWDPWALLQPGFWLSFMAVALLMSSEPVRRARPDTEVAAGWRERTWAWLRGGVRAQLVATFGLAPLAMVCFQQCSLVGLAANLVAVPVVTFVVTPLALLGLVWSPALAGAALVLGPVLAWLDLLGAWLQASWPVPAGSALSVLLALVGGACLVMPWPWRMRALGLILLLPLAWPALPSPPPGQVRLLAADVGQGSAVLLRTHRHLLVFDAGPQVAQDSDAGRRILLPLLNALGERRIDTLVLSHQDLDHVGGAASLMAQLPVGELRSSLPEAHPLRALGLPHMPCEQGQRWQWDGVRFEFLHPRTVPKERPASTNSISCVLRVEDAAGRRVLLTGDIEAAQEAELVQQQPERLRAEVLVVPHHGSKSSSSEAFLAAVAPRVAVIQVAYRSRFGHPHPSVLARYQERGIDVVRTDQCGAWQWEDAGAWCTRDVRRRYWQAVVPKRAD